MITPLKKNYPIIQNMQFDVTEFQEFEAIERELRNVIADSEGLVRDMCYHLLNAGGKRIRPLLLMYSGNLFSCEKTDELMQAAVAAELIHMASLVHDDIIDNSTIRRSKPSVNKVWGNNYAVLCGDYLFSKAFGLLSQNRIVCCIKYMVDAIQNLCYGEILQASERYLTNVTLDAYYNRIAKKTAIFLACICKSGAAIAGANSAQMDLTYQYGINLGYAFQIIDDILDFCGNAEAMGKPAGEDLLQGNLTLPIILLINNDGYGDWIRHLIHKRNFTRENISKVKFVLEETGIINKVFEIADNHIESAKKALDLLPKSRYNDLLCSLTKMLKVRTN